MATDFTNNNTTISTTGGFQPKIKNTPLDMRTRVKLKADIDSIPNPFVGMKIIVLQDETNDNQMTEYVVTSLKANALGVADMKVNEVVLAKDFLGISGNGMSDEQVQQLNTAYAHSQTPHVQQSDIPTKTSQLQNDSNFISSIPEEYVTEQELAAKGLATETFVTNKIAEASLSGGEVDLSGYATKDELKTKANVNHAHMMSDITDLVIPDVDKAYVDTQLNTKANKSDIPTKTSQLTNDSNFISSIPSEYVTETELESKGYLTEHQNISGKADKSYVDTELAKKSDKTHAHSYNDLSDKPVIPSVDDLATKKELTDGLATKSNTNHTHDQYLTEHQDLSDYALKIELPSVPTKTSQLTNDSGYLTQHQDISGKADKTEIPTKTSQLTNDSNFISSIPSEYITETELNTKGYLTSVPSEYITETELNAKGLATETFVTNKIAEASLSGGEVDLSGYATKDELNSTIQDYTGGKKQIYLTQAEYDLLTDSEKNDSTKVYNIVDATEQVIPTDLTIDNNNLLQLKDSNGNTIGTGVTVSTTSGGSSSYTLPIASSTVLGGIKVGNNLSIDSNGVLSATVTGTGSGMTDDEIDTILINVFGEDYLIKPCTGISLDQTTLSLNVNDTQQLIATVTPEGCTDEIIWSANNENCTVSNGLVRAVNVGECIITATCGDKSATCTVTAKQSIGGVTEDGYIANGLAVQLVCDDVTEGNTVWTDRTGNGGNATVTYKNSGAEGEVEDITLHKDADGAILMTSGKTYMTIPKEKIPSEGKTIEIIYGNISAWEPVMSIANRMVFSHTIGSTGYSLCVDNNPGAIKAYNAYASLGNKNKRLITVTVESDKVVVYENGNLIETIEYDFSTYLAFTENYVMNSRAGSAIGTEIKNTKFYTLRIYDRILTEEEISANATIDIEKYSLS